MKGKEQPLYRALQTVNLTTDRQQYPPGTILDLSHLPRESIQHLIKIGLFETADGEPENEPANEPKPCKNC